MKKEKLHKFSANSLTDKSEIEEIIEWIEASPENQKEFNTLKNLWAYSGFKNFDELTDNKKEEKIRPLFVKKYQSILKYAAIFLLAFLLGVFSLYMKESEMFNQEIAYNEVVVPFGETAEVILEDQTHVWLNSGARMKYPSKFNKKTREVQLLGEAYFEVKRNEKKPFHVNTAKLKVNVLGTSFNVDAMKNSDFVNITLVEGKVNLENTNGEVFAVLAPNDNARYNTIDQKVEIEKVNTVFYTSWIDGMIVFKDEHLFEIAKKLEKWFNIEVIFDQESVKNIKFTGSILKNKPIDQILDVLKYTSNIEYSIEVKDQKPNIIHLKQ